MIKEVSRKVDEDADAKRRALDHARMRARSKEKEREKAMMRKIRDNRARERETAAEGAIDPRDALERRGLTQQRKNDVPMDVDEDTLRMPPPPNLPAHRLRSASSDSHSTHFNLADAEAKELSPVNMSPLSANAGTRSAIRQASTLKATKSVARTDSFCSTRTPSPPQHAAPITVPSIRPEPSSPPPSLPDVQRVVALSPGLPSQSKAKSRPPVLGMRRAPSSSQPSSQGTRTTLPLKQKQFKTPFAKPAQNVFVNLGSSSLINSGPAPSTPFASHSFVKTEQDVGLESVTIGTTSRAKSSVRTETFGDEMNDTMAPYAVIGPSQSNAPHSPESNAKHDNGRSSSPPAEANDSFTSADFDMGIDSDELEEACRMYD